MPKPETVFANEFIKSFPELSVTKIFNLSAHGTPDLLAFHKVNKYFMMIELKVTNKNIRPRLSPHQVSFFVRHNDSKSFLLIKHSLASRCLPSVNLFQAAQVQQLATTKEKLEPLKIGYPAIREYFNSIK